MIEQKLHLLWVDDDKLIRRVAAELLEVLNINGTFASSGSEAVEKLSQGEYDILVTDISMPDMSGWELITKIKSEFSQDIKIIVTSGSHENMLNKSANLGIDYILRKPFKFADLRKAVTEIE